MAEHVDDASTDTGVARSEVDLRHYVTVEELLRDKLSEAIGGWRGALESAVPTLVFAITWVALRDLKQSLLAAGACVVVLLVVRLLQRQDPRFIAYAAVGVGISAFFALRSGQAEDAFLPGMLQNAGLLVVLLVTNLFRWPLFGFIVAVAEPEAFAEDPTWWHKHPGIVTVALRLAWVLIALNVVRLAIMVPLYLAEQVAALGVAKVVLGWPAYILAVTAMGAILVRGHTPIDPTRTGGRPSPRR
ncbi:DUF3159 domain-containing protein [Intrasporangium calvum]|uniref:DUF3159 domain-containing protein n=1 Tax=Intrasporangium calvum (strain ATCC 23552 / DSM 43043 / JCM 3097 / NBRC 12989 / NCIMB 10167 / NRRL B-3866 / 7 KIP) TaxID=710696 RepID=E6SBT4_INTC7|nr:DUF3159 domain-containing protein [Intrasporangium calvum]ADU48443.1 hypothetical protein Intca_1932 [Intrasporangium calvum DSM 43043]AXG13472.1 DUF3159 domain-containing protein [Intrasporangium calvum]